MASSPSSTEGFQPLPPYEVNDPAWKEAFSIPSEPDAGGGESTDIMRPSSEACQDVCKSVLVGPPRPTDN